MSIVRISHDKEKPYVIMNRASIQDNNISWAAKGLWAYLISLPDNWQVSVAHLCSVYKGEKRGNKRDAVRELLTELKEHGYVSSEEKREKGKILSVDYTVYESKQTSVIEQEKKKKEDKLKKCSPQPAQPCTVKPAPVNHRQTINNDRKEIDKRYDNINVNEDRSRLTLNSIVFDPDTYVLPNGNTLSLRMRNAIRKYNDEQFERLRCNVEYFESIVSSGKPIKNYEAYLQNCIKYNYQGKESFKQNNALYAAYFKELHNLRSMEVLKTVVRIKRSAKEPHDTIPLSLSEESFANALEGFLRNI